MVNSFKQSSAGQALTDVEASRKAVFICLGLAFVYSILYIYAMSRFADCLAKFAILIIEVCLAGSAGLCFYARGLDGVTDNQKHGYLIGGAVIAVVFVLMNMLLCCFWKQVKVAIAVLDATADFFAATKRIIFPSIIYFAIIFVIVAVWFAAVGCIASLNTIYVNPSVVQGKTIVWQSNVRSMEFFMFFGLIWVVFFI